MRPFRYVAPLLGRTFLAAIFIVSGFGKLMSATATQEHMAQAGLPLVTVLYVLTVAVELGGGLLLLVGWKARWAALAIFLFMIPVTLMFHWEWGNRQQETQFFKNLAIMGGLLMVVAYGPGLISLDRPMRHMVPRPDRLWR